MANIRKINNKILITFNPIAIDIIETIRDVDGVMLSRIEGYAVDYLVSELVEKGLWDKVKALYGFIGGTAATHRWNWKDMLDTDAAFRLIFNGTILHDKTGINFNATGFANTFFNPYILSSKNSLSMGLNINGGDGTGGNGFTMGAGGNGGSGDTSQYFSVLGIRPDGQNVFFGAGTSSNFVSSNNPPFSKGNYIATSLGSSISLFKNKVKISAGFMGVNDNVGNNNILLGTSSVTNTTNYNPTNIKSGTITIGDGLTDQEAIALSNIITIYNRILNRA